MRLIEEFFRRDCLEVAPDLVGKMLYHRVGDEILSLRITETEAYCGEEDTACHAHKGRTKRNAPLYEEGGITYVYLCYGIHNLLNVITGENDQPQGVLIRACEGFEGPGKLTKRLSIDRSHNIRSLSDDPEIWIEDDGVRFEILTDKRVGIGYASVEDQNRLWRFKAGKEI